MIKKKVKIVVAHTFKAFDGEVSDLRKGAEVILPFKGQLDFEAILALGKMREIPMVEEKKSVKDLVTKKPEPVKTAEPPQTKVPEIPGRQTADKNLSDAAPSTVAPPVAT